ncbi:MAG: PQ-loop domain-containing transporter [Candidatus Nanoarchaeia archaeon]|nr:PQ-loop domain-containing transporter [Candidatus Nanoarchaeia archaeon]
MEKGMYHFHRRKRVHKKLEKYPSNKRWVSFMDKLIYLVIATGLIMTIPQVCKIWIEKNASGVSIISWSTYLLLSFFWLVYGFIHKEKPIILSNILWILMYIFIILGVWLYG